MLAAPALAPAAHASSSYATLALPHDPAADEDGDLEPRRDAHRHDVTAATTSDRASFDPSELTPAMLLGDNFGV